VIDDLRLQGARPGNPEFAGRFGPAPRRLAGWAAWLLLTAMAVTTPGVDDRAGAGALDQQTPVPAAASSTIPPPADRGSLVICGGGGLPESVRGEFLKLAGGPTAKIVVIPTAGGDADGPAAARAESLEPWIKRGAASATVLHTRSRARADEPDFTRPLEVATGVWFGGGDQSRVTEVYLGTGVERALHRVLERGGVIGGTSAGAAVMSHVMITGGRGQATVGTGFGFLPGAVVDQHILKRNRVNRLLGVLAEHPELTGVGVDEGTALVVGHGRWRVVGNSYVVVCRSSAGGQPIKLDVFHDGDEGNLEDWKPRPSPAGPRR
jgi:cyanophycinase